jgi:simple sugar transport system ATP-binding protein
VNTEPVIQVRNVSRRFGHIVALRDANLIAEAGKVSALVGDNGAGKSTLIKILSGAHQPDGGEILLEGQPVRFASPQQARDLGIETVYQDLALAPSLDVASNLFLGREFAVGVSLAISVFWMIAQCAKRRKARCKVCALVWLQSASLC